MNGSYYKTPVFINDIERDTTNPITIRYKRFKKAFETS